jgi:hypothetical protein
VSKTNTDSPGSHIASIVSDYRFCTYRLNVLKDNPNPDQAAIAAILSRMKRLAGTCPGVSLPDEGHQRI